MLASLYSHRGLIVDFARREMKTRYVGSLAGFAWHVLNPILLLAIYTIVFSQLMTLRIAGQESGLFYTVYLCAGLLPWLSFQETVSRSTQAFIENANLIKKVFLPEEIFVANVAVSSSLNLLTQFSIFMIFLAVAGLFPGGAAVFLLPIFLAQQVFAFGLGLTLASANIFFRDVGHLVGMGLQAWFWATPIVYFTDIVPESFRWIFQWNPLYHLVSCYHDIIVHQQAPALFHALVIVGVAVLALVFANVVLEGLRSDIRDEV